MQEPLFTVNRMFILKVLIDVNDNLRIKDIKQILDSYGVFLTCSAIATHLRTILKLKLVTRFQIKEKTANKNNAKNRVNYYAVTVKGLKAYNENLPYYKLLTN